MPIVEHRSWNVLDYGAIEPPPARRLFDHWIPSATSQSLPTRGDLDVDALQETLSHLALLRTEASPFRARYEIVGDALVRLLGRNLRHLAVDEVYPPEITDEIYASFESAIASRTGRCDIREFRGLGTSFGYHRLILPFEREPDGSQFLIVCIYPRENWLRRAADWKTLLPGKRQAAMDTSVEWSAWRDEKTEPRDIAYV